ncbi:hypothetical protein [Micromonospora sp. NRRL B-16802]|uniref:hypothetical protein n=1 Tax=Micromonospora sp. NRRL B-16802 TaxID=1415541 RepID=UPI0018D1CA1B|nr:hypothetical protein [Micromonospora sp. NRRL B-16802]
MKAQVIALAGLENGIGWDAQADATIVRTHQHAAGTAYSGLPLAKRKHAKASVGPAAG